MLPFLKKPKQSAGIAMEYRAPDDKKEHKEEDHALEACAEDVMQAISSGDKRSLAAALRAAFQILDAQPHVEGEHISEE